MEETPSPSNVTTGPHPTHVATTSAAGWMSAMITPRLISATGLATASANPNGDGAPVYLEDTVAAAVGAVLMVPLSMLLSWGVGLATGRLTRAPAVIGYVLTGYFIGPYSPLKLVLLRAADVSSLHAMLDSVCLGAIAVSAGSELLLHECKKSLRAITGIVLSITAVSLVFSFLATVAGIFALEAGRVTDAPAGELTTAQALIIASIVGVVCTARSPAAAVAVLNEVEGKGIFCSLTLSVIVAKDVLVFVLFALLVGVLSVSPSLVSRVDHAVEELATEMHWSDYVTGALQKLSDAITIVVSPILQVGIAVAVGWAASKAFVAMLRLRLTPQLDGILRPIAVLMMAATVFTLTDHLNAEPMLANVVVGLFVANHQYFLKGGAAAGGIGGAGAGNERETLERSFHAVMPSVNLLFFTMIGATVKAENLSETIVISLCIWGARIAGIIVGCRLGYWVGRAPQEHSEFAWMAYITQAGVALGLVKTVSIKFPEIGAYVGAYLTVVILLNMLCGPLAFKAAIFRAGEGRRAKEARNIEKEVTV